MTSTQSGLADVLPLSPSQEGLLFHATYAEQAVDEWTVPKLADGARGVVQPQQRRDHEREEQRPDHRVGEHQPHRPADDQGRNRRQRQVDRPRPVGRALLPLRRRAEPEREAPQVGLAGHHVPGAPVHARRADLDQHLVGGRLGSGDLRHLEDVG